jgi:competence protein ComEA
MSTPPRMSRSLLSTPSTPKPLLVLALLAACGLAGLPSARANPPSRSPGAMARVPAGPPAPSRVSAPTTAVSQPASPGAGLSSASAPGASAPSSGSAPGPSAPQDGVPPGRTGPEGHPSAAGVVNLNSATVDELQRLPRIGEEKALRIIAHRDKTPFKHVHELARVRGIGLKTLRKLKPYLTTSGPTTLQEKVRGGRPGKAKGGPGTAAEAADLSPELAQTPPLIL